MASNSQGLLGVPRWEIPTPIDALMTRAYTDNGDDSYTITGGFQKPFIGWAYMSLAVSVGRPSESSIVRNRL